MTKFIAVFSLAIALFASLLFWHREKDQEPAVKVASSKEILYWYDPMHPEQHFAKPGKSPYMNMDLVPKVAGEKMNDEGIRISPSVVQNLGVRLTKVERIPLSTEIDVSGLIGFDEREVAILQARANGFVEKIYGLAPGDVIKKGDAIVMLSIPKWTAAKNEYLAAQFDPSLKEAARERMRLAGIPENDMREIEKGKKAFRSFTLRAPVSGVIQSLDIRQGMSVSAGQTLVRINGLSKVWLDAAVPQSQSNEVHAGDMVSARMLSGETIEGKVEAVLPVMSEASRTVKVRISLPNPDLRLRPGASSQVKIGHAENKTALAVPTEALIRTGKRTLVMVSKGGGRFVPVEVNAGEEIGNRTVILSGLMENQEIASSGQFLIDSEANLSGVMARSLQEKTMKRKDMDESDATIVKLSGNEVTLKHGPFKSFGMPGMTMTFPLANPDIARGMKTGDRVHVMVRKTANGLVVTKMGMMP